MAELVPAIHVLLRLSMSRAFVYMMSNRRNGILYTGVTNNLRRRAYEHREGLLSGFTNQHGLKNLVWFELTMISGSRSNARRR